MGSASDYAERKLLDWVTGKADPPTSATRYVALFTSAPNDDNSGTEVSGGSYARQSISTSFPAAAGTAGSVSSNADITFPTATANWGTITHWAIFDASTLGNQIAWGALTASKVINNGDTFKFLSGNLTVTCD